MSKGRVLFCGLAFAASTAGGAKAMDVFVENLGDLNDRKAVVAGYIDKMKLCRSSLSAGANDQDASLNAANLPIGCNPEMLVRHEDPLRSIGNPRVIKISSKALETGRFEATSALGALNHNLQLQEEVYSGQKHLDTAGKWLVGAAVGVAATFVAARQTSRY